MENNKSIWSRIHWPVTLFLIGIPVVTAITLPLYLGHYGFEPKIWLACLIFAASTSTCISGGYHRLFSHRAYKVKPWVKFAYLLVGAGAFQASALKWSTDHRRHHRFVDTDADPYSINKGFFFAHFGWMLLKDDEKYSGVFESDLENDRLIWLQHKYYVPIAFGVGLGLPILIGWALGSVWGGLVVVGFFRIFATHQITFMVNSYCHMFGARPYCEKGTARDSYVAAILTNGEGYHNFHHRFATDYRNGVKWYHWDPTKWMVRTMSWFGWTYNLKAVPATEILNAKIKVDHSRLLRNGAPADHVQKLKDRIEEAQKKFKQLHTEYKNLKKSVSESSRRHLRHLKWETKAARLEFKSAIGQWISYRRTFLAMPG